MHAQVTIGSYLAQRLEEAGLRHYFAIPGDFNLLLLDELLKNPKLELIGCCNELNAGYAADGYARAHGLSALVITYSVGGLSAINAVAGAYAEDLPIIVISGSPGTDAEVEHEILHHTLGNYNYRYVRDMFAHVTAESVIVAHPDDAPALIDKAIMTAIASKKPVYLEIPCNIAALPISAPGPLTLNVPIKSDPDSLAAAVEHVASALNAAVNPLLIAGVKLRSSGALKHFDALTETSGYPYAVMPDAKGFVSELRSNYLGTYWGMVSSPAVIPAVKGTDRCLCAGPRFSDYVTAGFSLPVDSSKLIHAAAHSVSLDGQTYTNVELAEFLEALTKKINRKTAAKKLKPASAGTEAEQAGQLTVKKVYTHVQDLLNTHPEMSIIVETGDGWANATGLTLPDGCGYEIQLYYASLGWSIGATLGYALSDKKRRVLTIIGDGGFQMTAQEISTMIRYNLNPILLVVNNHGYLIEKMIHDGPYNTIKNWNYAETISVFNAESGNGWGCQVTTHAEMVTALEKAIEHNGVCLIEIVLGKDDGCRDCNRVSLELGALVAAFNNRPPKCMKH